MKTCPKCNNPVDEGVQKCPYCGSNLSQTTITDFEQTTATKSSNLEQLPNYLPGSIVVTAIFGLFGLPALILSIKSWKLWKAGEKETALIKAKYAKKWRKIGLWMGILTYVVFFIIYFVGIATKACSEYSDFDY